MAYKTDISWTDSSVNFWTGCIKISDGCKYCYMYRDKERYGQEPTDVMRTADKTFYAALKWKQPKKIFTCSWSDFFIEQADAWRKDAWEVIKQTPQHQWQILTKRPERIAQCLPPDWGEGYQNVWLGISAENQANLDERLPMLMQIPAKIRFISAEPLLGSLDLFKSYPTGKGSVNYGMLLNWCIIGGESGNDTGKYLYRPCKLEWIEDIIRQCAIAEIPVFVKQLGSYMAKQLILHQRSGADSREWFEHLKIQKFPI